MDNQKDKNQNPQLPADENQSKSVEKTQLFQHLGVSDEHFLFQYKKTEKILAALYLVTNFLSNQEPIRWQLRELGLTLLSNIMSLKDALPSQKDALCTAIKTTVFEMISMLEIAHFAGFISPMNFEVLKKEFVLLLDSVSHTKQTLESFVLPNNFFTDDQHIQSYPQVQKETEKHVPVDLKDKNSMSSHAATVRHQAGVNKGQNTPKHSTKNGVAPKAVYGTVLVKKTTRQNTIIDLLKKKKVIMIKDVSALIDNCSEKTLQRELISMVEQGILRKEGERRWSKYFLA